MRRFTQLTAVAFILAALLAGHQEGGAQGGLAWEAGAALAAPVDFIPTPAAVRLWRSGKIRDIWREANFGHPPPAAEAVNAFLDSGDLDFLDKDAAAHTYYLESTPTLMLSATGMLLAADDHGYRPHCTVVLLAPSLAVTASHCLRASSGKAPLRIYFPWEGFREVLAGGAIPYCGSNQAGCSASAHDLALLKLARPYGFIPSAQLASKSDSRQRGWGQGFGDSNLILSDRGLLLGGRLETSVCRCPAPPGGELLCVAVDYANPPVNPGQFVALGGHSGGPLYTGEAGKFRLAGIMSHRSPGCEAGGMQENRYVDLVHEPYRAWISAHLAATPVRMDTSSRHRPLLAVPVAQSLEHADREHLFAVPPNTRSLAINLNHETRGFNPQTVTDLHIVPPPGLQATCERHIGAESCIASMPPEGTYTVGIQQERGQAAYQLSILAEMVTE